MDVIINATGLDDILDVVPVFSELECSQIGLGMAALGRPGYINLGHAGDIIDRDYQAMHPLSFLLGRKLPRLLHFLLKRGKIEITERPIKCRFPHPFCLVVLLLLY